MSELTPCNFCTLNEIKYSNRGKKVTLKNEDGWLRVLIDGKDTGHLFMAITDHCVC